MNPREEYLNQYFNEWLDRFSPPRAIQNNPKAMQDDANAMMQTVLRHAPGKDYAVWLDDVLRNLAENMTTRSWPAPGELAKACKAKASPSDRPKAEDWKVDEYEAVSKRMRAGEAVGEGYLYGRQAVELIKRGLVDKDTMMKYRSAAYFHRKDTHGQASATAWEDEAKERHEAAKLMLRDTDTKPRNISIPNKREVPGAAA